jgi:pimeloyl-ACP methyl ester carboxylesterase
VERAPIDGIELEYEVRGTGEPIVLIHAGVCADFFVPLVQEPALSGNFTLVRYHRTGYAGSGRLPGAVSLARQAAHCRALMRHLGIERAHIVGHSSSASIALQLGLDAPDAVQSLALLDPARPAAPSAAHAEMVRTVVGPALQRFRAGDKHGAIDAWMRGTCGAHYRAALERALPGALDQAVADADTFFGQELPAVIQWTFGREDAARIHQPALAVLGEHSIAVFRERRELLLAWLPNVEPFDLPDATHLLQVQNPGAMASGLASFFSRHPLRGSPTSPTPVGRSKTRK